jgi:hypothetical protein
MSELAETFQGFAWPFVWAFLFDERVVAKNLTATVGLEYRAPVLIFRN